MKIITDLPFLDAFYHAWTQPHGITIADSKARTIQGQFLSLLLEGATVHCAGVGPNLQQYGNPLLLELNKLNRLRPLAVSDFSSFASITQTCTRADIALFCLGNPALHDKVDASAQSGYLFFKDVPADEGLFVNQMVTYNRQSPKSWAFATNLFQPHHSVVIADAYLFNEQGTQGLLALLAHIQPKCLGYPYWITLLGSDAGRKNSFGLFQPEQIRQLICDIEALFEKAGVPFVVEAFVYNGHDFHDRYILTNNLCVLPGYGVSIVKNGKETPHKEGTWTAARPFSRVVYNNQQGVYFEKVMREKLKTIRQWIGRGDRNGSGNPLMKE
jgi:predicted nucleic acid-binding Zn finger protein